MKIGVLTSSRADYGIYLPLLNALKKEQDISLEIIAFGTHLSRFHGYTVDVIKNDCYHTIHEISSLITNDNEESISTAYGLTVLKFAEFWAKHSYDVVFCLGDRYEMSAAVQAGIPFQVNFAHIHGGETTLGAIDNIYRHQISLASSFHFVATETFKYKVEQITGTSDCIYNVGSLSLSDIQVFKPKDKSNFLKEYNIPFKDYALVTFHPETVSSKDNLIYAQEMKLALRKISNLIPVIVTMPNADTLGSIYREKLMELRHEQPDGIILIENFGKENYFNAMYYAKVLIGNTSSGIIEAASFKKYVINVGDRQKGRVQSKNIFNVPFKSDEIISSVNEALSLGEYNGENAYYKENAAENIIHVLHKNLK